MFREREEKVQNYIYTGRVTLEDAGKEGCVR